MKRLVQLGFELCATEGTHKALEKAGVKSLKVLKISEAPPQYHGFDDEWGNQHGYQHQRSQISR